MNALASARMAGGSMKHWVGSKVRAFTGSKQKGQTGGGVILGAIGLMVSIAIVYVIYIMIGNLSPSAQDAITQSNDSYPGQALLENTGVLFTVLGGLIGAIVLVFAAVYKAWNTSQDA